MDLGLENKVVLITGGSRGIGRAAAVAFAEEGASVALCARDEGELEQALFEVKRNTGMPVFTFAADLTDPDAPRRFVEASAEHYGRINILINNAGAAPPKPIDDLTESDWDLAIDLKLRGYIRTSMAVLPYLRQAGGGHIVNVVGGAGRQPGAFSATSGLVNSAIMNFTRSLADRVAPEGIVVNAVAPGPVKTERLSESFAIQAQARGRTPYEIEAAVAASLPTRHIPEPEEIARIIVFAASDCANLIVGSTIAADSGSSKLPF